MAQSWCFFMSETGLIHQHRQNITKTEILSILLTNIEIRTKIFWNRHNISVHFSRAETSGGNFMKKTVKRSLARGFVFNFRVGLIPLMDVRLGSWYPPLLYIILGGGGSWCPSSLLCHARLPRVARLIFHATLRQRRGNYTPLSSLRGLGKLLARSMPMFRVLLLLSLRGLEKPKQSSISIWIIIYNVFLIMFFSRKDCLTGLLRSARNDAGWVIAGLLCSQ